MKRLEKMLCIIVLLLAPFGVASAQEEILVDYTINLEKDTWLSDVAPDRADRIGKLTLTGYLKGADFKYLKANFVNITELDLSNASIIETEGSNNIYLTYVASDGTRMQPDRPFIKYDYYVKDNTVGYWMFLGFRDLEKLILPGNITSIEDCSIPCGVNVEFHDNPNFIVENGLLLNKDKTRVFVAVSQNEKFAIPSTVKEIAPYSFARCTYKESFDRREGRYPVTSELNVEQVEIPSSVEEIGEKAFDGCEKLTTVTFSANGGKAAEMNVGKRAFYECAMTGLQLPDNINAIGDSAFCKNQIQSLTLKGAKKIGRNSFNGCPLESVVLPENLEEIGDSAFLNFTAPRIAVPASVKVIGKDAFWSSVLKEINVDSGNEAYSSEDGVLLNKERNTILLFPGGRTESYTSPDFVTEIAAEAFRSSPCESVKFPKVKVVGEYAFRASRITTADLPAVESLGQGAFYGSAVTSVKIPLVEKLEDKTFYSCLSLKSIDMMNVVSAESETFYDLTSLETLVLGEKFTSGYFTTVPSLKTVYAYNPVASPDVYFGSSNHTGDTNMREAVLYVPKGSFNSYYLSNNWGDFKEIIEMGEGAVEEIGDDGAAEVYVAGGKIVVEGVDGNAMVEVYDLSGRLAYSGTPDGIPQLSAGMYIVRVAGVSSKVVIN